MTLFNMSDLAVFATLLLISTAEASNSRSHACGSAHAASPPRITSSAPAPAPALAPAPAFSAESPENDPAPDAAMIFDVTMYGAVGDGKTENGMAFLAAWDDACNHPGKSTLLVPNGTFFIGPISFIGPCQNNQSPKVEIRGTLKAPSSLKAFPTPSWIMFRQLQSLILTGETTTNTSLFDAQGEESWRHADCRHKLKCQFPTSIILVNVTNGNISNITLKNGKGFHMGIINSDNVTVHGVNITAPWNSPNTDGVHIGYSTNIHITSSTIGVGDDCVSIGPGSINITVFNTKCGPGHGISVGSLGKYSAEKDVVGVRVKNCTINGTQNGVRIKTWPGSPASKASSFWFEDIVMINVSNPIIIDQEYCPWSTCTSSKPSLVKLSDIHFTNIRGTFNTKSAVALMCSSSVPCEDIQLLNINLTHTMASSLQGGGHLSVKGALHRLEINGSSF
ncbi:hypothetical protein VitviT2T_006047 [Vitis vinifera]|uniref:Exopolygalacturonase n=1 Tax=Vitis vinifera TaxID=29760 RepID=A0ABY9BV03_VITVI|nr:hypothetical protein VitviT2T_006047 [Vitis vinifera]